ncbi:SDR family NAD(P)-dependent oxidoreductase [Nocardia pseudobrasiliensis]|uniref:Acyl transferase domain-containing protein n=1 Tax=Nocardia pseudobrasiliensis TaxID=45979 RepID=A0A370HX15_9NOCA|nr:type I polyketide synthase [Nocardia pseudobrasiliensis]RDI63043.1 acyl transferase domain-containing protein [Nocardia pseudobrasiliensis]
MIEPAPAPPVSIIGIGCRMPGVAGVRRLWGMLLEGGSAALLESEFDHDWFGIDPDTAAAMDPRERLSLTVAIEALDDAGIGYRARGSPAAVLVGAGGSNMIANRVSQVLDLRGPSLVLDSAGSSSLAAVDLAVRLLSDGTVPWALVGGVDAHAGTVVVLQRTADARREGNRVYAEILGTAVGSDGRSERDGSARRRVIRTAWERAGLDPHAAGYFECHGGAATSGDSVEIDALAAVLRSGGAPAAKIWVGSVTADLGPLDAAAGVTGLAKAALCIQRGIIAPASIFRQRSAALRLDERGLRAPTEPIGWQEIATARRVAGIGSVGVGGTTAHAVLRGATEEPDRGGDPPVVIALSGADEGRVRELAGVWADALLAEHPPLRDFSSAAGRLLPERVRAAVVANNHAVAVARLRGLARGHMSDGDRRVVFGPEATRRDGGVLLLFPGRGGEHARMGRALAARYPVFARAVAEATDAVVRAGGPRVWTPRHGFDTRAQAIFVFQLAMAELVRAFGIRADGVIGTGAGEIAAAVVSEAISLRDGARLAVARAEFERGRLRAVLLETTLDEVGRLVEPMRGEVVVAAVHGPDAVVIAGPTRRLDAVVRRARRRGVVARAVSDDLVSIGTVDVSPLDGWGSAEPRVPMYSTTRRGEVIGEAGPGVAYWVENAGGPVHLDAALEAAAADGMTTVLEMAPDAVLSEVVREYPDFRDSAFAMAGREDEAAAFLGGVARLYLEGRGVDWAAQGAFSGQICERYWRKPDFDAEARSDSDFETAGRSPSAGDAVEWHSGATAYGPTVATALDWAESVLRTENWIRVEPPLGESVLPNRALVIGESPLAVGLTRVLDRRLPTQRVAREFDGVLARLREPTAVVVIWSGRDEDPATAVARAVDLLTRLRECPAVVASTVVLRDHADLAQNGVAGVVRALRRAATPHRLLWSPGDDARSVAAAVLTYDAAEELSIDGSILTARRFRPVPATAQPRTISPDGTYVVTGGLGTLGAVAARWLLHAGARDVVVLTRTPRPLPPLLDGLDDRIVVARCDVADRADLASALEDIRACGSTIRGLIHAAGAGATTAPFLPHLFAPTVRAATDLLTLTTADPIDFTLLFTTTSDDIPRSAITATLDTLARAHPRTTTITWGAWQSAPSPDTTPLDAARATAILTQSLTHQSPTLLALDPTPPPRSARRRDSGDPPTRQGNGSITPTRRRGEATRPAGRENDALPPPQRWVSATSSARQEGEGTSGTRLGGEAIASTRHGDGAITAARPGGEAISDGGGGGGVGSSGGGLGWVGS